MASLVRWDPFTDLASFWQRDINRLFGGRTRGKSEWLPAADVLTKGDDLVIRLEIPGIDPDRDLEITVEEGMLHIRGERQETEEEKGEGYIRRETSYGAFERSIPLPTGLKPEDLKASYTDGILEILIPGAAKRPTQRVPVEITKKK